MKRGMDKEREMGEEKVYVLLLDCAYLSWNQQNSTETKIQEVANKCYMYQ